MLRKLCCLGLIMVFLFSASALAEYDQYRLTVGDKLENLQKWEIFPLDAHNVIVRVYNPLPWHVSWYRDGKLLRTLVPEGDYDSVTPVEPVFEGDGSFSMLCRISSEEQSTDKFPPPNAQAEWTEEGLTRITPLKERVYATRWDNRIVFSRTDEYVRIRYNGKDTCITRELADILRDGSCIALADEVFLTRYFNLEEEDTAVLCLDHGNIRYRIEDPLWCDRFLPDGQGGFFTSQWDIAEWTLERDYSPVRLTHYDRDGKCDRVYQMKGDRVFVTPQRIYTDPGTGTRILYGSAVEPDRKVCSVFAMTLDENMNVTALDVRDIDPDYNGCEADIYLAPNGSPWVFLYNREHPDAIRPAAVPFFLLDQSGEDYGLQIGC